MSSRSRAALVLTCVAGVTLSQIGTISELASLGREDSTASHLLVIPFVSLALILQERRSVFASIRLAPVLAVILFLLGGALLWIPAVSSVVGSHPDLLSLKTAALIVLWLASFVLVYGRDSVRAAAFPLCFLAFMIPIPHGFLDGATLVLKSGSAEAVAWLFWLTGTPYHREGFVFALSTQAIEVADACSGIRSSIALVLTSLLAGHMFLTKNWARILVVLAVLPITILKNAMRIVGLSLLAVHVDPAFLAGRLHHDGGIVFFVLALLMLTPIFGLLHRIDARSGRQDRQERAAAPATP